MKQHFGYLIIVINHR